MAKRSGFGREFRKEIGKSAGKSVSKAVFGDGKEKEQQLRQEEKAAQRDHEARLAQEQSKMEMLAQIRSIDFGQTVESVLSGIDAAFTYTNVGDEQREVVEAGLSKAEQGVQRLKIIDDPRVANVLPDIQAQVQSLKTKLHNKDVGQNFLKILGLAGLFAFLGVFFAYGFGKDNWFYLGGVLAALTVAGAIWYRQTNLH